MGQEAGPQKKRTFSKSEGAAAPGKVGGRPRDGGKPRDGSKKPQQGKPFPKKEGFKKRDAKAHSKGGVEDDSKGGKFQVVRAQEPEKYKKINYGQKGGEGLNRRQKQKVSDLIKRLRVSNILWYNYCLDKLQQAAH